MDKRYFKINYTWFDELSCEAAVTYGYLVNSLRNNRIYKIAPDTGELFYRVPNSFIINGLYLSPYKIKSILDELEDNGYIETYLIKKPNQKCRYIKCNYLDLEVVIDIFYDIIKDYQDLLKGTILSYIVMKINMYNEESFDLEDMLGLIGGDWNDSQVSRAHHFLKLNDYIDENDSYTDKAYNLAHDYAFSWIDSIE